VEYEVREAREEDASAVVAIFNHFVRTSFAAYPSVEADPEFYARMRAALGDRPVLVALDDDTVVGFAMLKSYHPADTLRRTGELTYFVMPDHTRRGLGTQFLERLTSWAEQHGIDTLLANISSENEQSQAFHRAHGFRDCGRMRRVGRKFGRDFDVVWMQRTLKGEENGGCDGVRG
jgi:L-amino acid N-acyltransferase YncA